MDDHEWDLLILRGHVSAIGLSPADDLCPDLDRIANGNGSIDEKVDQVADEVAENVRARRQSP